MQYMSIPTKTINNVTIQENGIIRDESGKLIARLVDEVKYEDIQCNPHLDTFIMDYLEN